MLSVDFAAVELGTPAKIVLVLSSGRNDVSKAMVRLSAPSGVKFQPELAELQENESGDESGDIDTSFEEIDGAIVFFDIKADKTVQISVPHSDASAYHAMVCVSFSPFDTRAYWLLESGYRG